MNPLLNAILIVERLRDISDFDSHEEFFEYYAKKQKAREKFKNRYKEMLLFEGFNFKIQANVPFLLIPRSSREEGEYSFQLPYGIYDQIMGRHCDIYLCSNDSYSYFDFLGQLTQTIPMIFDADKDRWEYPKELKLKTKNARKYFIHESTIKTTFAPFYPYAPEVCLTSLVDIQQKTMDKLIVNVKKRTMYKWGKEGISFKDQNLFSFTQNVVDQIEREQLPLKYLYYRKTLQEALVEFHTLNSIIQTVPSF